MLLYLLYLEFFILMKDVSLEMRFILLQILSGSSIVEIRWHEFIEIFYMHKLWVYLFKHAFIESLF